VKAWNGVCFSEALEDLAALKEGCKGIFCGTFASHGNFNEAS